MCSLALLAQVSDPISIIGSGWVGAGLLGAVLAWLLLVHLPARDKQFSELAREKDTQLAAKDVAIVSLLEVKDNQIKGLLNAAAEERGQDRVDRHKMRNDFTALINEVQNRYNDGLATVTEHCREENAKMMATLIRELNGREPDGPPRVLPQPPPRAPDERRPRRKPNQPPTDAGDDGGGFGFDAKGE